MATLKVIKIPSDCQVADHSAIVMQFSKNGGFMAAQNIASSAIGEIANTIDDDTLYLVTASCYCVNAEYTLPPLS